MTDNSGSGDLSERNTVDLDAIRDAIRKRKAVHVDRDGKLRTTAAPEDSAIQLKPTRLY